MQTVDTIERDRRHLPIQVEKHLIFQWLPVIGPDAFSLLLFYMSLADDGRTAYPSIRFTAKSLGTNSVDVQLNNKVLEWAGLITVKSGNRSTQNRYIIQNPPRLTQDGLDRFRAAALDAAENDKIFQTRQSFFYRTNMKRPKGLIDRLNDYEPVVTWYSSASAPKLNGSGLQIPQQPAEPEPENEILSQLLQLRGMRRNDARRYLDTLTETQLIGWLRYFAAKDDSGDVIENQASYLHTAVVVNGDTDAPPLFVKDSRQRCRECGSPTDWQNGMCSSCMDALGIRY